MIMARAGTAQIIVPKLSIKKHLIEGSKGFKGNGEP